MLGKENKQGYLESNKCSQRIKMFRVSLNGKANVNYSCFWLKFHSYLKFHKQHS